MKKVFFAVFVILSSFKFFAKSADGTLKSEIISEMPCEYKEVALAENFRNIRSSVSFEQMKQDVDVLIYILQNGYAGYDDMLAKGFDTERFRETVISDFSASEPVESRRLFFLIKENLSPFIEDAHFILVYFYDEYSFCKKNLCYWTDVFIQKKGDDFIVCESAVPGIRTGDAYTGSSDCLFYYPVKGNDVYRLGILSAENISEYSFLFNGRTVPVSIKNDGAIEVRPMKYHDFDTEKSAYIALNSFIIPAAEASSRKSADIIFEKFVRRGFEYNDKKNIILDFRSNMGGYQSFSTAFFYCLYKNKKFSDFNKFYDFIDTLTANSFVRMQLIDSPVYRQVNSLIVSQRNFTSKKKTVQKELKEMQKNPVRRSTYITGGKNSGEFSKPSEFKGKLVILIDRNTVSAAECAVNNARQIFGKENVIVIGENSFGMCAYVCVYALTLPNSGIAVNMPFAKNCSFDTFEQWHGEGTGIFPDYWASGSDLNETIYLVTGDEEMKERLKNIEFSLQ